MNNDILIFRTSIRKKEQIKHIGQLLSCYPQINKWNVDFEDREKILRIESKDICATEIIEALQTIHIYASELV